MVPLAKSDIDDKLAETALDKLDNRSKNALIKKLKT